MALQIPEIQLDARPQRKFPTDVDHEAMGIEASLTDEVYEDRTEIQGVSIDGLGTRTRDDAIWIEREGDKWIVHVSIADVRALVQPESYVDREAMIRLRSRHSVSRTIPMIPPILSRGCLSLDERAKRPTMTISITLGPDLSILDTQIRETYLVNQRAYSYGDLGRALREPTEYDPENLPEYLTLAQALIEQRRREGALVVCDPERGWMSNEEGQLKKIDQEQDFPGQLIVQECMILAGRALADFLVENRVPTLFRNHHARLDIPGRAEIRRRIGSISRFPEMMDRLRKEAQRWFHNVRFDAEAREHFGLNLGAYTQATSPIRRYPDLVVQRTVAAFILEQEPPYTPDELAQIAHYLNERREQVATEASTHFKNQTLSRNRQTLISGNRKTFAEMDVKTFASITRMACRENRLTEPLKQEWLERLESGRLRESDLYALFFERIGTNADWQEIEDAALAWLATGKATALLNIVVQKNTEWETYDVQLLRSGTDGNRKRCLIARSVVVIRGEMRAAPELVIGETKHQFRQRGAFALLKAYLEGTLVPLDEVKGPTEEELEEMGFRPQQGRRRARNEPPGRSTARRASRTVIDPRDRDDVSALQSLCQARNLDKPVYHIEEIAPDQYRGYVEVTMPVGGQLQSETLEGTDEKTLRHRVARNLMIARGKEITRLPGRPSFPNFVQAVQALLDRHEISDRPTYNTRKVPRAKAGHLMCQGSIAIEETPEPVTGEGIGWKPQEVKNKAAAELYGKLHQILDGE